MIYILDEDLEKSASYLDDKSLDKCIRNIAQVLCNVHYQSIENLKNVSADERLDKFQELEDIYIKYFSNVNINSWTNWARECKANYLWLVEYGELCGRELNYRFEGLTEKQIELEKILILARHNVPDLPYKYSSYHSCDYGDDAPCVCLETTHLSLIMPNKYQNFNDVHKHFNSHQDTSIYLYRNYYQAKIEKKFKGHKSISMNGTPYYSTGIRTKITWTKREKPEWLSI